MGLFDKKLEKIESIINDGNSHYRMFSKQINESLEKGLEGIVNTEENKVVAKVDYGEIESLFGTHKFSFLEPKIGPHPDFSHLSHDQYLNHYAVSMFVDIKGSTFLSNKYSLLQIRQIKDTILTLAIEVCSFFGGHIHRLQGDGIFVYFVRSEMNPKDAVINSLNAASLLTFFMKYKLPVYFEGEDIKAPQIRVGIDYGDEEKTIWSYYGLTYCNELTTTGLHTDLAAKLQSKASSNGVLIGDNIVNELDLQESVAICDPNDKYIFPTTAYKKYNFKWEQYLLTFDFFKRDGQGGLTMEKPRYSLKCEIAEENSDLFFEYHQNLYSIPKKYKIRFTLMENGVPYNLKTYAKEHLDWQIVNTGKEAMRDKKLKQAMTEHKDKIECQVNAEFLGHHDMQCKIIRQGNLTNVNVRYPVFVR